MAKCALCGKEGTLRESHVLPAFVFRWLRERSVTGHIRHSDTPNRRVQDGLKKPWLCDDCETRFSRHETHFATKVFHPWLHGEQRAAYDGWLLKFCVSISWRVLAHCKGLNPNRSYTAEQEALARRADVTWRSFLLDEIPHPGQFEQHLLIFDIIAETDIPDLPNNFNRYITGGVEMDMVGSERTLLTYAKLGRFCIFGIIQKGPNKWEGTKVHVTHGLLEPRSVSIPHGLLHLFKEKASLVDSVHQRISETQHGKIDSTVMKNIDRLTGSDQFAAMMADAEMFGEEAIIRKSKDVD